MHLGHNVARLRNYRGIKQEDMAKRLRMTQQNYSLIENSAKINEDVLKAIAKELEYDAHFIKELPDTPHVYSTHQSGGNVINYTFNPIEKIVELYDALLKSEREKIALLENMIKKNPAPEK